MSGSLTSYLEHVQFSGVELAGGRYEDSTGLRLATESPPPARRKISSREELPEQLDSLTAWLLSQGGVDARAYRPAPLLRRLPACLRHLRVKCPASARALLDRQPHLVPAALNMLLIGVTEFFRDDAVFQRVRDVVIPELVREREVIRIYGAGVSSGEELYSIALLLAELGALERCEMVGVDCRPDAIAQARRGVFRPEPLERIERELRSEYFHQEGSHWLVDARIRARIEWRVGDLLELAVPERRDLILFRNVAIYLDDAYATAAWTRLTAHLNVGGFLVSGRAEQPPRHLPLQRIAPSIYRRT